MTDTKIVTIGYGSEYPFDAVVKQLRARGFECYEIDMAAPSWRNTLHDASNLRNHVLLTSQHPGQDRIQFRNFYGFDADIIDLSQAMHFIRPARSYYVPHDLVTPIHDEETLFLKELSGALMPDDRFWYLRKFTQVHEIGWIKAVPNSDKISLPSGQAVFLPSELGTWIKQPPESFQSTFSSVLDQRIPFKMPKMPGLEVLRRLLVSAGCEEIPAELSSTTVIQHYDTVISMGDSSVMIEGAWMGKRCICVADGHVPIAVQRSAFAPYTNIEIIPPDGLADALIRASPPHPTSAIQRQLDIEKLINILNDKHSFQDFAGQKKNHESI